MLDACAYASLLTAILATIAAVARGVPILEVFADRRTPAGKVVALSLGCIAIAAAAVHWRGGITIGGVEPLALIWPVAILYFWWTIAWRLRHAVALAIMVMTLQPAHSQAWNALGHRVVADIAWSQLEPAQRQRVVETLHRHPKYAEQFVNKMQDGVEDEDRWLFGQAAVWADQIRGNKDFDMPVWHYVDFPLFIGPERPVSFPLGTEPEGDRKNWNVMQAIAYCRSVLADDAAPPADKAVAYCWIFHLVGDLHQPLHSTALVCEKLPEGDRGGNDIKVVQGRNLHSLWDGLLGRSDRPNDVKRAVLELEQHKEWWDVDTTIDVPQWVAESHAACKASTYCPEIVAAVQAPGELASVSLPQLI